MGRDVLEVDFNKLQAALATRDKQEGKFKYYKPGRLVPLK